MKISVLGVLTLFFISSVYAQDMSYNTITTTSIDANNPNSIRIIGQNNPVGPVSARNISFDFESAGKAQIQAYRNSSMGTTLQFLTNDDGDPFMGAPTVRMQISRNGNVGIGLTNPTARLSVVHGEGYGKVANFSSALGDEHVGIGTESNGFSWIGTTSNHNFQIYANNEAKLSVLANGSVGIGTIAPAHKLTVLMDAWTNGEGVAVQAVTSTGTGSQPGYALLNSSGNKRMYSYLDVFTDTYNIGNASGTSLMTLNQNGNVGIGTVTPGEKLSVNGNIRAKEIKVENANWPDYVFTKEYQLPTLQATENHIKEKGHLPGIPSAVEVKANGIDLGEMNAKLLQKIEELTLYMIEQNKRIQTQNEKLALQEMLSIASKKDSELQQKQIDQLKQQLREINLK
ncbi:hypothetical protein [Pedobacter heparinus]|uniref:Peptidase S74 domain-containing protein n=1 Tax=Pedobacter heparinus (strain ATCC 13125 / DSM 2366 / CIP 104194 / JCM 7457 / NBRC 12017 / NCIMB 9290 / NRRL B-14731 / HIM 762-3) TaxID=485917 RepID=C6Y3K4_PEDHD|nr:hypothetical protein [Pedobacter heparinus]ACU03283.1 hypothetical protein Phep_1064 [Pedobacter heparinus DSM 2366]